MDATAIGPKKKNQHVLVFLKNHKMYSGSLKIQHRHGLQGDSKVEEDAKDKEKEEKGKAEDVEAEGSFASVVTLDL